MKFHKYQALGNDYIVLEDFDVNRLTAAFIKRICDRHYGVGSDGILTGRPNNDGFLLRIFNPDGSEAEKSGNGLRIFARYLWDTKQVSDDYFSVHTKGGKVRSQVRDEGQAIFVEMGQACFDSNAIPVTGDKREVVSEKLHIAGHDLVFTGVTVGNPHCVIHTSGLSAALTKQIGPVIETHPLFPNRTNVQFVEVLDEHRIRIEIWERGAGYTLASGSSSCAAAAASVRLGLCSGDIDVVMPGGTLKIGVGADYSLTMVGPAQPIASGTVSKELVQEP